MLLTVASGLVIVVILLIGGLAVFMNNEQKKMKPLATGEVVQGVYAVNNEFVNFYLIRSADGYIAFDAGKSDSQSLGELELLGISPDDIQAVLLTHSDGDHTAALSIFPNASIYLSEYEVQMIDGTTRRSPLGGNKLSVPYQTFSNGEKLELGSVLIECIHTPGHTPGSMCFYVDNKYLFSGDTMSLSNGKAKLFNSFYNMDDEEQAKSLGALAKTVTPEYIFTAHYGYTDNVGALEDWAR